MVSLKSVALATTLREASGNRPIAASHTQRRAVARGSSFLGESLYLATPSSRDRSQFRSSTSTSTSMAALPPPGRPRRVFPDTARSTRALDTIRVSNTNRYTRERSSILVIGLNVHTASVGLREQLAVLEPECPRAINELCAFYHIEEAAVLNTCDRMEIYVVARSWHMGIREVTQWMVKTSGIPLDSLRPHLFVLRQRDATRHLLRVACGLQSLGRGQGHFLQSLGLAEKQVLESLGRGEKQILDPLGLAEGQILESPGLVEKHDCDPFSPSFRGEGQTLSQVKQAFKAAQDSEGLGRTLHGLLKQAIVAGERVRAVETSAACGAFSKSSAAVELAMDREEERRRKVEGAHVIIEEELLAFEAWRESLESVPTILRLREKVEAIRRGEVERVVLKMGGGVTPEQRELLEELSRGVVDRILHGPMAHLRGDGGGVRRHGDVRSGEEVLANVKAVGRMFDLAADEMLVAK